MVDVDTSKYGYYHYGRVVPDRDAGLALVAYLSEKLSSFVDTIVYLASFEVGTESCKPHVHVVVRSVLCQKQRSITPLRKMITGDSLLWSLARADGCHFTKPSSALHVVNTLVYIVKDGDLLLNNTGLSLSELQAEGTPRAKRERRSSTSSDLYFRVLSELSSVFSVDLDSDDRGYFVKTRLGGPLLPAYDMRYFVRQCVVAVDKVYASLRLRIPNMYSLETLELS